MALIDELKKLVGKASDAPADIEAYLTDMSLCPAGSADAVVYPESTDEVSAVVKYAYENDIPVVPVSSQTHMYGSTIPKEGGIIIDMKNMNKILEIDVKHKTARIQPGVTWKQLYDALDAKGMRVMMPLAASSQRSVLSDTLDRALITNTVYDYGEPTQSIEIVWGDGSVFRAGSASNHLFDASKVLGDPGATFTRGVDPSGPGLDFYRLVQGAQGTMGIVTWMQMKIELKSTLDKVYFAPSDDLDSLNEFLYKVMPRRVGQEIAIFNKVDLATIIADKPEEIADVMKKLPEYTLVMVLSGLKRLPEEKIAYEEKYLKDVLDSTFKDITFKPALPGFPGLGKKLLAFLKTPEEGKCWKEMPNGAYEDLFFICRPGHGQKFVDEMKEVLATHDYPHTAVGVYQQPIEHNRASQMMFTFFYDPEDEDAKKDIAEIYYEAGKRFLAEGAQFTRPYGNIVPLIYDRAGNYTAVLKRLKKIFDEKNIFNPGTLCF